MLLLVNGCVTQPASPAKSAQPPVSEQPIPYGQGTVPTGESPPFSISREGETLTLVRMMDGGACQNDDMGAQGVFMLYADSSDIKRIKQRDGAKIFARYERMIQELSLAALRRALTETRIARDPFALDDFDAQQKVARALADRFRRAVAGPIRSFEQETTLTIDIVPLVSSFRLFFEGCEAALSHDEGR